MHLRVDAYSPIPIGSQPTEPLTHVVDGGGVLRDPARPCIREFAGFVDTNASAVGRVIEDLRRSGYRPLRSPGIAPPSSMSGCPPPRGATGGDGEGKSFGDH